MNDFDRGFQSAARWRPGLHHALPAGAQQMLREASLVGSHLSTERTAAIRQVEREIRERWPALFREETL